MGSLLAASQLFPRSPYLTKPLTALDLPLYPFLRSPSPYEQLKEFGDSSELYAEEQQAEVATKNQEIRKRQEAVPGLLNPHVRQDDMDM